MRAFSLFPMLRINRETKPNRVTLLTTVVILLLIAWTGMAVITIFRANLARNETIETMQRAFDQQTLDLEQRIRELEGRIAASTSKPTVPGTNFSLDTIKIGDTVAGMKVVKVEKSPEVQVWFEGKALVEGTYFYPSDAILLTDQVCLKNVKAIAGSSFPKASTASEDPSFCLTNKEDFLKAYPIKKDTQGTVRIEVESYHLWIAPAQPSYAKFVQVLPK